MKKVCLVTYSDKFFKILLRSFEKTKLEYCKEHNIDFFFEEVLNLHNEKLGWKKIELIKKYLLLNYDYVIMTDYDSVVVNNKYNVLDLIESSNDADIICSKLENGFMLLGCSIFKNTAVVKELLNFLITNKSLNRKDFLAEEKIFNDNLHLFPLRLYVDSNINCIYNIHTLKEPFILHYAGVGNPIKIKQEHAKRYNTK
jgi:hypothetical protein